MDSIFLTFSTFWNLAIIICSFILLMVIYFEMKDADTSNEKLNKRYSYHYIEDWKRMNNEYFKELANLDLLRVRKCLTVIHKDFKKMLEIKYNLIFENNNSSNSKNSQYLSYISNQELREFMLDPNIWFKEYYLDVKRLFDSPSDLNGLIVSKQLFPQILNLETLIIKELNLNLNFKKENIELNYEQYLIQKAYRSKRLKAVILSLINLIISVLLIIFKEPLLEIAALSFFGFLIIYIYLKVNI